MVQAVDVDSSPLQRPVLLVVDRDVAGPKPATVRPARGLTLKSPAPRKRRNHPRAAGTLAHGHPQNLQELNPTSARPRDVPGVISVISAMRMRLITMSTRAHC